MSHRDDAASLQQMLDYAREIQSFSERKSLADLRNDRLLQLALIRLLEVVGEAATRIGQDTREKYTQIP